MLQTLAHGFQVFVADPASASLVRVCSVDLPDPYQIVAAAEGLAGIMQGTGGKTGGAGKRGSAGAGNILKGRGGAGARESVIRARARLGGKGAAAGMGRRRSSADRFRA